MSLGLSPSSAGFEPSTGDLVETQSFTCMVNGIAPVDVAILVVFALLSGTCIGIGLVLIGRRARRQRADDHDP